MKTSYQLLMKQKWNGQKVRSLSELRVLNVEEHREEVAAELKNKIDSLTAILKSSTLRISKPEGKKMGTRKNNTER